VTSGPIERRETPVPGPVPRLELADWATRFGVVAGITTRANDFNLGLTTATPAREVIEHWRQLANAMRPAFQSMVGGLQVHGAAVAHHRTAVGGWTIKDGVDGHVTTERGVLLLVSIADCVPIYLCHPGTGTLGLLHAGWRGIAGGMLEAGVAAMTDSGAIVSDIVMHCGVAICGSCYEVGPEVLRAVTGEDAGAPGLLDLRTELAQRARRLGIAEVSISPWCAAHDSAEFFSHRRSAGRDGRMLAYLGRG
jgi:purine-nucleoside/S-methyl-5'-thioadenosine phosphorylase / adenosine deaminase